MSIDSQGNLYASAGMNQLRGTSETLATKTGVYVISPQGKLLKFIPIPEDFITNNAFGGPDMKTLYVTAGKTLYKVRTDIAGPAAVTMTPGGSSRRRFLGGTLGAMVVAARRPHEVLAMTSQQPAATPPVPQVKALVFDVSAPWSTGARRWRARSKSWPGGRARPSTAPRSRMRGGRSTGRA